MLQSTIRTLIQKDSSELSRDALDANVTSIKLDPTTGLTEKLKCWKDMVMIL